MNRKKSFYIAALSTLLLFQSNAVFSAAGYIVKDATVTSVANTFGSGNNFIVNATGGTNNKCQGLNIWFKLDTVTNEIIHARAYSTALTAFASGSKVNIWSTDGTCEGAGHIQVKK